MVTKSKKDGAKKGRIKVGKLKVNKETVKDLTGAQKKQVRGGAIRPTDTTGPEVAATNIACSYVIVWCRDF